MNSSPNRSLRGLLLGASLLTPLSIPALAAQAGTPLDPAMRGEMIEAVLSALNENYVYPDVAKAMEAAVRAKIAEGSYDRLSDAGQLTGMLQSDLRAVCKDKHLSLQYSDAPLPMPGEDGAEGDHAGDDGPDSWADGLRQRNWGFQKVEVLEGNVGYLDLRNFAPVNEESSGVAAAAMNFLAGSDALIIDLRQNGGGDPAMVAFLSTYLFGEESLHLNSLEEPRRGTTHQWWTLPFVPGRRFGPDKPVYVLTSHYTFSAAEEFSYNLLNLERATLVGETTGGGAHPVDSVVVHPHIVVRLPFARAVNPISGTNWEGTGVPPHIETDANSALAEAHLAAVDSLIDQAGDSPRRASLLELAKQLEAKL